MRDIATLDELRTLLGSEVAVSDWVEITQRQVDMFADATSDHQWIHQDTAQCREESPFGGPIAHGYLTLSMLSGLFENALRMVDVKTMVNYGLNKVRFPAPVPVGSRVRARMVLAAVEDITGGAQLLWDVTIEREGGTKPVCVAEVLVRRYS
jgi:acyl dehydratase